MKLAKLFFEVQINGCENPTIISFEPAVSEDDPCLVSERKGIYFPYGKSFILIVAYRDSAYDVATVTYDFVLYYRNDPCEISHNVVANPQRYGFASFDSTRCPDDISRFMELNN